MRTKSSGTKVRRGATVAAKVARGPERAKAAPAERSRADLLDRAGLFLEAFAEIPNTDVETRATAFLRYLCDEHADFAPLQLDCGRAVPGVILGWTTARRRDEFVLAGVRQLLRLRLLDDGVPEQEAGPRSRVDAHNWLRALPEDEDRPFADFIVECCEVDGLADWWQRNGWRKDREPSDPASSVTRARLLAKYRAWCEERPGTSSLSAPGFYAEVRRLPGVDERTFGRARKRERGWSGIGLSRIG